jgi:hypothetical protein
MHDNRSFQSTRWDISEIDGALRDKYVTSPPPIKKPWIDAVRELIVHPSTPEAAWDNAVMPLVRIDLRQGKAPEYRAKIGGGQSGRQTHSHFASGLDLPAFNLNNTVRVTLRKGRAENN